MKNFKKPAAVKCSVSSASLKGKKERKLFTNLLGIFMFVFVRRARPTLKFSSFSYAALNDYSKNVMLSLTGNLTFPTPPITLVQQGTDNGTFQAAIVACGPHVRNGSLSQRLAVRAARVVIEANLRALADYVDSVAQGDAVMINSSGFMLSKPPQPFGILDAPVDFRQLNKKVVTGQTALRWGKVRGASSYNVYTAPTVTDPFVLIATVTKTSYTNVGVPGRTAYYTIRAVGAAGLGIETTPLLAYSSF